MANELNPGETRIGWLYDGEQNTPVRAVGLRNTGDAIHLEIPLDGPFGANDPYSYWFQGTMHHADDPAQVKRRYEPPLKLLFPDVNGRTYDKLKLIAPTTGSATLP
ncbi:MAG: hypothetical protein AAGG08_03370 [Actinomycetota bacterium]